MITARRLVADFDIRFDRFHTQYEKNFRLVEKLSIINEAFQIYFDNRVRRVEVDSEVRGELRPFEKKEVKFPLIRTTDEYSIFEIPEDKYKILRLRAKIRKGSCPPVNISATIFQTDDLNQSLRNVFWSASYEWEQIIADEGKEGMYLFHQGQFEILEVVADYIFHPGELHAPSLASGGTYVDWNGITQTLDRNIDSNVFNSRIIVDIAVLIARNIVGDLNDFQAATSKILNQKQF